MLHLDHVFVFVADPDAAIDAAAAAGLAVTHQRVHRGQGTENRCYGFDNGFVELLWCRDRAEIESAAVAPTGLGPRSRWWESDACPFGVCLRASPPPIRTWTYGVPFPPGMSVEMAATTERASEPVVFFFPPPDASRPGPTPGRQSLGSAITALELAFPLPDELSEAMQLLNDQPHIRLRDAAEPWLSLTIDGGGGVPIHLSEARVSLHPPTAQTAVSL